MEVAPNVHHIPGVIANPYLLIAPEGLMLVDAGLPGSQRRILRYLAHLRYQPADLKRILITHADFDHVGGLAALKSATGAKVYAHPIEAAAIASGRPSRQLKPRNLLTKVTFRLTGQLVRVSPMPVDGFLEDGQVLPVLGGLRVLSTPGHTPGHVSYFSESTGVLFSGDSVVSGREGLRVSRGANTWDQSKAIDSLRLQAALGARIVCPGHGPIVQDAANKFPAE